MRVMYTCGVYDLFHYGHLRLLQRAKEQCDWLIVGVVGDYAVKEQKGTSRPIYSYKDREAIVKGLECVDTVWVQSTFDATSNLKKIKKMYEKSFRGFIKGADQDHITPRENNDLGIEIITLERTDGISTSDTIKKMGDK